MPNAAKPSRIGYTKQTNEINKSKQASKQQQQKKQA